MNLDGLPRELHPLCYATMPRRTGIWRRQLAKKDIIAMNLADICAKIITAEERRANPLRVDALLLQYLTCLLQRQVNLVYGDVCKLSTRIERDLMGLSPGYIDMPRPKASRRQITLSDARYDFLHLSRDWQSTPDILSDLTPDLELEQNELDNLLASLQDADHADTAVLPGVDLPQQVVNMEQDADSDVLNAIVKNDPKMHAEAIHQYNTDTQYHHNDVTAAAAAAAEASNIDLMDIGFDDNWSDVYHGSDELDAAGEGRACDVLGETWTDNSAQLSQVIQGSRYSQHISVQDAGISKLALREDAEHFGPFYNDSGSPSNPPLTVGSPLPIIYSRETISYSGIVPDEDNRLSMNTQNSQQNDHEVPRRPQEARRRRDLKADGQDELLLPSRFYHNNDNLVRYAAGPTGGRAEAVIHHGRRRAKKKMKPPSPLVPRAFVNIPISVWEARRKHLWAKRREAVVQAELARQEQQRAPSERSSLSGRLLTPRRGTPSSDGLEEMLLNLDESDNSSGSGRRPGRPITASPIMLDHPAPPFARTAHSPLMEEDWEYDDLGAYEFDDIEVQTETQSAAQGREDEDRSRCASMVLNRLQQEGITLSFDALFPGVGVGDGMFRRVVAQGFHCILELASTQQLVLHQATPYARIDLSLPPMGQERSRDDD